MKHLFAVDKDDKWLGIAWTGALRWATDDFEITLGQQRINWEYYIVEPK